MIIMPFETSFVNLADRLFRLDAHQPALDGEGDGFGAVACAEFRQNRTDVEFDRPFRDDEGGGDLAVSFALRQKLQDSGFALGQRFGGDFVAQIGDVLHQA